MIDVEQYRYLLPEARIATWPLEQRDQSKLLVYRDGAILHSKFEHLSEFIPSDTALFFNNTRVIPARILFEKSTGATIEVFLLKPSGTGLIDQSMLAKGTTAWHCAIGNVKRWTPGTTLSKTIEGITITATLADRPEGLVEFKWTPAAVTFAEVLLKNGETPLPPYIRRKPDKRDEERYQTVYSSANGAVAAPTAGLHFTEPVLETLRGKSISTSFLTLHVSAGTFQPLKVKDAVDHVMHEEQVVVSRANLEVLMNPHKKVVAVGTTSLRTLESLYWYGVRLLTDPEAPFIINKMDPYQFDGSRTKPEALAAVCRAMDSRGLTSLTGSTAIYILPGYGFRVCDGLITNFHQPASTLMLLVAAFVGEDWKMIYDAALGNDYRFLSYGDGSLLWRDSVPGE